MAQSSGGFGGSSSSYSVDGSSGAFRQGNFFDRCADYDRRPNYYGTNSFCQTQAPSGASSSSPVASTRRVCCAFTVFFSVAGTIMLLFGVYGPAVFEVGLSDSRLLHVNSLLVKEIQMKMDEGVTGPILYGMSKRPSLDKEIHWTRQYDITLEPRYHKEWAFWLNKGSTMTLRYDIQDPSMNILVVVVEGKNNFNEWVEDPNASGHTTLYKNVRGNGQIKFHAIEDANYYFAVGNLHNKQVLVGIGLDGKIKQYAVKHHNTMCILDIDKTCGVEVPFFRSAFALLTAPQIEQDTVDVWHVNVSYKPRWELYAVIFTFIMVIVIIIWRCPARNEHGIAESAPLMQTKQADDTSIKEEHDFFSSVQVQAGAETGELPDDHLCVICLDARKDSFFDPCGHCATCYNCGLRIQNGVVPSCPICRQTVQTVRKLYM